MSDKTARDVIVQACLDASGQGRHDAGAYADVILAALSTAGFDEPSRWMPIETAEKKSGWILGWAPGWIPVTMSWTNMHGLKGYDGFVGWYVERNNDGTAKFIEPTHWRHLPSEPATPPPCAKG